MAWYAYIGFFFAGVFLVNAVPHFVHGVSGEEFQTPFGNPSSALLNVIWGAVNFAAGGVIITLLGGIGGLFTIKALIAALGGLIMAIVLSIYFSYQSYG